ncbi:hypothetical protein I4F81_007225 [Pyropia yezoensis]|uniref:Uncharacterized protein n=1 Tax=Pyropia yezoensis TaxID=2788 RepID=A0ACC3C4J8_PYRYE|nr:hypothetical protein I4F81_007225 [Neopyropia yezoensis]
MVVAVVGAVLSDVAVAVAVAMVALVAEEVAATVQGPFLEEPPGAGRTAATIGHGRGRFSSGSPVDVVSIVVRG